MGRDMVGLLQLAGLFLLCVQRSTGRPLDAKRLAIPGSVPSPGAFGWLLQLSTWGELPLLHSEVGWRDSFYPMEKPMQREWRLAGFAYGELERR